MKNGLFLLSTGSCSSAQLPSLCQVAVIEEYGEEHVVPSVIIMEQGQHRVPVEMYNDSGEVNRIRKGQVVTQLHQASLPVASPDQKGADMGEFLKSFDSTCLMMKSLN